MLNKDEAIEVRMKVWLTILISIIAIITSTIAMGQYLTFGPLEEHYEQLDIRLDSLEKKYVQDIADIRADQKVILAMLHDVRRQQLAGSN
ncbi:MAG: hypothetical protein CO041_04195 [Candidatus Pacebacteria bacterium CG_4_9_14_0_2_um_filter_40_15]|nr:MAG: hypothetical protein COY01_03125 [Candidatus Pacebacteria bacterium CG_4_10_14_0_2_um_filter_40_20]PJC41475.1 MAG: hypothetical protein CO041_04195 [Candidatus Pacebacteria bacterium CG_4_9_14_0_2_um_filter_40_15]